MLLKKEGIAKIKDAHQKETLTACAEECLKTAKRLARPKTVSTIKPSGVLKKLSTGKKISIYIKGADKICVFASTIGGLLEKEASRLMEAGDHIRGYLLDRLGSFAVENASSCCMSSSALSR